jgi:hypothetical protein
MSISISSSTHVSNAQPAAQATPASPPSAAAKGNPLPQDTVTLSSQAQAAPAAKGTSDVDHDGDNH